MGREGKSKGKKREEEENGSGLRKWEHGWREVQRQR